MAEQFGGLEKRVYRPLLKEWVLAWRQIVGTPVMGRDFDKRVDILVDEWMEEWKTTHISAVAWLKVRKKFSPRLLANPDELRLLLLRVLDTAAPEWVAEHERTGISPLTWLDQWISSGSGPSRMAVIQEYVKVKEAGKKLPWLLCMNLIDRLRSHPHLLSSPLAEQLFDGLFFTKDPMLDGMLRWTVEDQGIPRAQVEEALRQDGWRGLQRFPRPEWSGLGPRIPDELLNPLLAVLNEVPSPDRLQRLLGLLRQIPGVTIQVPKESQLQTEVPEAISETKTCPDCAESVRAAARKCRFCGYEFV